MSRGQPPAGAATFKAFARILGERSPSYITQLKDDERLVLTEDGKHVLVQESLELIRQTADPSRAGVAARHAADRQARGGEGAAGEDAAHAAADAATGDGDEDLNDPVQKSHAQRKAKALADKEEALARKALRDEQLELGQLLVAEEVEQAVRAAAATLRTNLENLRNTIAAELAATSDEAKVSVILGDAIEGALTELSRQFAAIGKADQG